LRNYSDGRLTLPQKELSSVFYLRQKGTACRRVWLTAASVGVNAIRFYQRFGRSLRIVHINSIELSRKSKSQISLFEDGIPTTHKFEFEIFL
jgi:hypothetical protein